MARWYRLVVPVAGLLLSAFFLFVALRNVDLGRLLAVREQARLMPWAPLAVASYMLGHLARGLRLRFLLRRGIFLAPTTATNVVIIGYASNNLLPARLGELVRAGMLAERTGIPPAESLTITFIERLFDGLAILGLFLLATSTMAGAPHWFAQLAVVAGLAFGLALVVVILAVLLPGLLLRATSRLVRPLRSRWRDGALSLVTGVTNAGVCLRRPGDVASIAAFSVVVWLLESGLFAFCLPIFSLPLRIAPAVLAMSVTNLGVLAPSTPGYVGTFQAFCQRAIMTTGVPPEVAFAYAFVVWLLFYIPVTVWGVGAMLWYGVQLGATAALARAAKAAPRMVSVDGVPLYPIARLDAREAPAEPSAFYRALTEAMLAPEPGGPDATAVASAATFVAAEMDALPSKLRTMLGAGLAAFRLYVRARYLRGFSDLSPERRRKAVNAWAYGPLPLLRQLFRPVRSVALLGYYEAVGRMKPRV